MVQDISTVTNVIKRSIFFYKQFYSLSTRTMVECHPKTERLWIQLLAGWFIPKTATMVPLWTQCSGFNSGSDHPTLLTTAPSVEDGRMWRLPSRFTWLRTFMVQVEGQSGHLLSSDRAFSCCSSCIWRHQPSMRSVSACSSFKNHRPSLWHTDRCTACKSQFSTLARHLQHRCQTLEQ